VPRKQSRFSFMFIVRAKQPRAFTLLEIIMAVAILATMALAIYRFVQSNIVAIRLSTETNAAEARYDGLREVLTNQWQSLAPGKGALLGDPFKLNDRERDEVRWICGPGPGLMTRYAAGDFVVALRMQPAKNGRGYDLGFLRKPKDDTSLTNANDTWVPLIENVGSLEIQYFDPQRQWQTIWNDRLSLPRLIKVTVGRSDAVVPWEVVIPIKRTPL
jgi:prepilin-type N-terminal cleavage/methylation domain-containing protein